MNARILVSPFNTCEKCANIGVCLPIFEKIFVLVYRVCDGEGAVSTRSLGVHAALREDSRAKCASFSISHVLQQCRPARPSGLNIDVTRNRRARCVLQKRSSSVVAQWVLLLCSKGSLRPHVQMSRIVVEAPVAYPVPRAWLPEVCNRRGRRIFLRLNRTT